MLGSQRLRNSEGDRIPDVDHLPLQDNYLRILRNITVASAMIARGNPASRLQTMKWLATHQRANLGRR